MRTTVATIKLINKRGVIYLSVSWKGRALKSTGIKCQSEKWDSVKERIKGDEKMNAYLSSLKNECVKRRDTYIIKGVPYTAEMVLDDGNEQPKTMTAITEMLINERCLRANTAKSYQVALKKWLAYGNKDDINYVTGDALMAFLNKCKKGNADGTIKIYLQRISSIVQYALKKGFISSDPFNGFDYRRKLKVEQIHPALTKEQMDACLQRLDYFLNNADVAAFKKKISNEACLAFFCFSYLAGGLAPIDVAKIKVSDVKIEMINNVYYYVINTRRSKTNAPVKCLIRKTELTAKLMSVLMSQGVMLFGIIEGVDGYMIDKRLNYLSYYGKKCLINELIEVNKKLKDKIDINNVTFYSARHSLATVLVNENVSLNGIASVMGRSINNIGTYIKSLTKANEIANIVDRLY